MPNNQPDEVICRDLKTKTVFQYKDPVKGFKIKSKEVYKNKQLIIHFPFNARKGGRKYRSIEEIRYKGISEPLPSGFIKSAKRGYGFTRELAPLLYKLENEYPELRRIVVSPDHETEWKNTKEIVFNLDDLRKARASIASVQRRHREEQETLANNVLAEILQSKFKASKVKYVKGYLHEFVNTSSLRVSSLSDEDIKSVIEIVKMIPASHALVKSGELLATKESVDRVLLEDISIRYAKLLSLRTDSKRLEDRWQNFFRDNILYFDFGYVARFEKERIMGDKTLNIPDFIMLNTFGYLDVFELKTHLTQLLAYDKGRNNFHWTAEAAKAISQAENYVDSIVVNEDTIIKNIRDEYGIHNVDAVRPKVYVIASCESQLAGAKTKEKYKGKTAKKLRNDFRRLNSSLKNIEFVLYDELQAVFTNTLARLDTAPKSGQSDAYSAF